MIGGDFKLYREVLPCSELNNFIECFWQSDIEASISQPTEHRVLPDGCLDLIFDLTPGRENGYWVGTMTTALIVKNTTPSSLLGIRFLPGGASSLLLCPASAIKDQRISIDDLTPSFSPLLESLINTNNRIDHIEKCLHSRVSVSSKSRLVGEIHRRLPGKKNVSGLAQEIGLSRQYLNRVMAEEVGIDLKTFSRVLRMRRLTEEIGKTTFKISWSDLAAAFGFYDQSHLIHEFKDLVGLSPSEFVSG